MAQKTTGADQPHEPAAKPQPPKRQETVREQAGAEQGATQQEERAKVTMAGVPAHANGEGPESTLASKLATVAAVGVGAALIEVELIPGMLLGVAAMLAPNLLPKVGGGLRPFIKGAVRAGYALTERAKETAAEASEQLQDIVAEVRAEHQGATEHPASSRSSTTESV